MATRLGSSNSNSSSSLVGEWLSPRLSFSRDDDAAAMAVHSPAPVEDDGGDIVLDFEFRLDGSDPVTMLPADELFSDGKLVPLQLKPIPTAASPSAAATEAEAAKSRELPRQRKEIALPPEAALVDQYAFSPRVPVRCSSRWRELLGLKRVAKQQPPAENHKSSSSSSSSSAAAAASSTSPSAHNHSQTVRGLKQFLIQRYSRAPAAAMDEPPSRTGPLLRDSSTSSSDSSCRLSLSSSSSSGGGLDHDELPRFSLDSSQHPPSISVTRKLPRLYNTDSSASIRGGRSYVRRTTAIPPSPRGASVDSPRMNSYGKVVFQSLERSSSSPSTFSAGAGAKKKLQYHHHQHRMIGGGLPMERSYSANVVRVSPVLNVVPVCSLRVSSSSSVLGFLSPHKRDSSSSSAAAAAAATAAAAAAPKPRIIN